MRIVEIGECIQVGESPILGLGFNRIQYASAR